MKHLKAEAAQVAQDVCELIVTVAGALCVALVLVAFALPFLY